MYLIVSSTIFKNWTSWKKRKHISRISPDEERKDPQRASEQTESSTNLIKAKNDYLIITQFIYYLLFSVGILFLIVTIKSNKRNSVLKLRPVTYFFQALSYTLHFAVTVKFVHNDLLYLQTSLRFMNNMAQVNRFCNQICYFSTSVFVLDANIFHISLALIPFRSFNIFTIYIYMYGITCIITTTLSNSYAILFWFHCHIYLTKYL